MPPEGIQAELRMHWQQQQYHTRPGLWTDDLQCGTHTNGANQRQLRNVWRRIKGSRIPALRGKTIIQ